MLGLALGKVPSEKGVALLNQENYEAFVAENPAYAVMVYAPWCGHSRDLLPKYEDAAKQMAGNVPFAKVDGTESEDLATALDIKGYPTILFVRRGGVPAEYDGDRSAASLVKFAQSNGLPKLHRLSTVAEVAAFRSKSTPHVASYVLYPGNADQVVLEEMMTGVASSTALPCAISTVSPEEAGAAGVKAPALVVYKGEVAPAAVLSGADGTALDLRRMQKFAKWEALPLVVRYSSETEEDLFGAE